MSNPPMSWTDLLLCSSRTGMPWSLSPVSCLLLESISNGRPRAKHETPSGVRQVACTRSIDVVEAVTLSVRNSKAATSTNLGRFMNGAGQGRSAHDESVRASPVRQERIQRDWFNQHGSFE